MIKYLIHGTHVRLISEYSPSSPFLPVLAILIAFIVPAVSNNSSLAPIIGVKVAKINTSFFIFYSCFEDTY